MEKKAKNSNFDSLEESTTSGFQVAYIYSFMKNEWAFSSPDILFKNHITSTPETQNFDLRHYIVDEDLKLFDNMIKTARDMGGTHTLNYSLKTNTGEVININDSCGVIATGESWPVLAGTLSTASQDFNVLERAEHISLVGNLSTGMIHDFKNLLAGIKAIVEWCISESDQEGNVSVALKKTMTYMDHANTLISGLFNLLNQDENERDVVNLGRIVSENELLIRHLIPSSIEFNIHVDRDLKFLYASKSCLQEIILNLCMNARNAMREKGDSLNINVFNKILENPNNAPVNYVGFSVTDNGCGMSEEKRKQVFDAYFTTGEKGTGIGLWMVKQMVNSYNGTVNILSKENEGSTIEVLFPAATSEVLAENAEVKPEEDVFLMEKFEFLEPKTIFIIEDEPLIKSGLCNWMENLGFNVLSSGDGLEALEIFENHYEKIDLVIQDFVLPGMKGELLLEKFLATKSELPIIVISAVANDQGTSSILDMGAYAYLPKPFKIGELVEIIAKVFENEL